MTIHELYQVSDEMANILNVIHHINEDDEDGHTFSSCIVNI